MPHDMEGNEVAVGDRVMVPCRVAALYTTEEFCNVTLETEEKMYPGENVSSVVLNARQVLKVS